MIPSIESQIPPDDKKPDDEKRLNFLFQIGTKYYENHNKKVSTAITTSGFFITVNGILILANMNLIQFIGSNSNIFPNYKLILVFSIISILLSIASIYESIVFIHMINPSSHNLSRFSDLMKPMSYQDLLILESETIFDISQANDKHYRESQEKNYKRSLIFFGCSIGALLGTIAWVIFDLFGFLI